MDPVAKKLYEKTNAMVERWSELLYMGLVKISIPLVTLPFLILSYFLYFTTDLGSDSFLLPFLVWYKCPQNKIFSFYSAFY